MDKPIKQASLTFDLDTPEGRESLKNAVDADLMKEKIETVYDDVFRTVLKYGVLDSENLSEGQVELIRDVFEKVNKHFEDFL